MSRVGLPEILILVLIIVLIFGARRLPELGRSIGESIKNFRTSMKEASRDADGSEKKDDSTPIGPK